MLSHYYSIANKADNNFNFRKVMFYESISEDKVCLFIQEAIKSDSNFCNLNFDEIRKIQNKCNQIKSIFDSSQLIEKRLEQISSLINIKVTNCLIQEIFNQPINDNVKTINYYDEVELDEIDKNEVGSIQLMSIVGSKGLSADHVIIIGFDNINMRYISPNAFYVAMTRARKSLHMITSLKSGGATQPCHFLHNLPDENLDFYSYKKTEKKALKDKDALIDYLSRCNFFNKK